MSMWVCFEVSKASCHLKFALSPCCLRVKMDFFFFDDAT